MDRALPYTIARSPTNDILCWVLTIVVLTQLPVVTTLLLNDQLHLPVQRLLPACNGACSGGGQRLQTAGPSHTTQPPCCACRP